MALISCPECKKKISDTAKCCPDCGFLLTPEIIGEVKKNEEQEQKAGTIGCLSIIIVIGVAFYYFNSSLFNQTTTTATSSPTITRAWRHSTSVDKLTGVLSAYAVSPQVASTRRMGFPYGDVEAWLGVGCNSESEWAYVGFNSAPNLTKTDTKNGYNLVSTRIKWDDNVETIALTQDWGASFLHFRNDAAAISKIAAANSVLLELQWYGEQQTHFEFSLNGSSAALNEIRKICFK